MKKKQAVNIRLRRLEREIQGVQRGGRAAGAAGKNEGAVLNWEEVRKATDAILKRGNDVEIRRKGDGYIVLEGQEKQSNTALPRNRARERAIGAEQYADFACCSALLFYQH